MATTSSEIIQKGPIELDKQFFVPPNVVDVRQIQSTDITSGDTGAVDTEEIVDIPGTGDVDYAGLATVDSIEIVSQTVKVGTGGTATVDVIIEVPDLDNITNYEVRVTKL